MILDEFLFRLGTLVDTSGITKMGKELNKVDEAAKKSDKTVQKSAINWKMAFGAVAGIATTIVVSVAKYADALINTLDKFAVGADAKQKQMLANSKKQITDLKKQVDKMFIEFKRMIIFEVLPYLLKIIAAIQNWFKANKELIDKGLKVLKSTFEGIIQVITNLFRFIDEFVGWKNAIMLVAGAVIFLKRQLAFGKVAGALKFLLSPLGLIAAAIGVILLLVDDLMTYMDGGESFFGEAWEPVIEILREVKEVIDELIDAVLEWWEESGPVILEGLAEIWRFVQFVFMAIVGFVKNNLGTIKNLWKATFGAIIAIIKTLANVFKLVMAWIAGDAEATDVALKAIWEGFLSFLQSLGDFIINAFLLVGAAIYAMFEEKIDGIFNLWDAFKNKLKSLFNGLKNIARSALEGLKAVFASAIDWIVNKFSAISNIISGIGNMVSSVGNMSFSMPSLVGMGSSNTTNNVNKNITVNTNNPQVADYLTGRKEARSTRNSGSSISG